MGISLLKACAQTEEPPIATACTLEEDGKAAYAAATLMATPRSLQRIRRRMQFLSASLKKMIFFNCAGFCPSILPAHGQPHTAAGTGTENHY